MAYMVAFWRAVKGFEAHRGFFLAAGLSFYFLICLIPLLLFLVAVAGFVLSSETANRAVVQQLPPMVPVYRRHVTELLERVVATRNISGALGMAILLLFSTQLFAALRLVMNDVFEVRQRAGLVRGLVSDILMVGVIGVLLLASFAATEGLLWVRIFVLEPAQVPGQWVRWLAMVTSFALNTAVFFITYRYFPSRRVAAVPAVAGALLASALWEVARSLFRWYILSIGLYDQVYGTFGVLVALFMFVYYTAIVCILGAEYSAMLEGRARRT
jgi:membrane protein